MTVIAVMIPLDRSRIAVIVCTSKEYGTALRHGRVKPQAFLPTEQSLAKPGGRVVEGKYTPRNLLSALSLPCPQSIVLNKRAAVLKPCKKAENWFSVMFRLRDNVVDRPARLWSAMSFNQ